MTVLKKNQVNLRFNDTEFEELKNKWTKWVRSRTGSLHGVHEISLSEYIRQLVKKDKP